MTVFQNLLAKTVKTAWLIMKRKLQAVEREENEEPKEENLEKRCF